MTQADSVHSTPRKTAFKIVAGTDYAAPSSGPNSPGHEQPPHKGKRRGPYKHQREREYQNGLPVIDPEGEADDIFRCIAKHREAIAHYDRCVSIENDAEGNVSATEFFYLQHNTKLAFDTMMTWARSVICVCPTTRRGLIHQARYLASQFSEHVGWDEGACDHIYLPDKIGDRPWFAAFLRSLATGLRKMAGEFPEQEGA